MKNIVLFFLFFVIILNLSATIINIPEDYPTIQEGIIMSTEGDTVLVSPGIYYENIYYYMKNITVASLFLTTQDTTYISQTIIDGNQNGSVVTFVCSVEDSTSVLCGFTIQNGYNTDSGGGIHIENSNSIPTMPILENLIIKNNYANYGGGIFIDYSYTASPGPILTNLIIEDNYAYAGGGIYIQGTYDDYGSCPLFQETLIYNNTAEQNGGGVYFENTATPILGIEFFGFYNCTITNNHANAGGGGFYGDDTSNSEFYNTILWGNTINYPNYGDQGYIYCEPGYYFEWFLEYNDIQNGILSLHGVYTNNSDAITFSNIIEDDPLFNNAGSDDYTLKWTETEKSPCIDTGNPNSPLDPDGTRADMGALYHEHEVKTYEFPSHWTIPAVGWKWLCFDILDKTINPYNIVEYMLDPIKSDDLLRYALFKDHGSNTTPQTIEYDWEEQTWENGDHPFTSPYGYKFRTWNACSLEIPGFRCEATTTFFVAGDNEENWIGYFLEETQYIYEAFSGYLDNLTGIRSQHWAIKKEGGYWPDVPYTLSPGEMVIAYCEEDIINFSWNFHESREKYVVPESQDFIFEEEVDYIPIFISLDPEDIPSEIGAYVDGECKGATVVQDTSSQLCAYILENQGQNLEFEFSYGIREQNKRIKEYGIYDPETSKTVKGSIQINNNRDCYYVSFRGDSNNIATPIKLEASNYPNPFNPVTTIAYSLPENSQISISIYNIKGQKVKTLATGTQPAGDYNVTWNGKDESGKDVTSGIYFYKLITQNNEIIRKMLLLK